jgi:hypothetical protein
VLVGHLLQSRSDDALAEVADALQDAVASNTSNVATPAAQASG